MTARPDKSRITLLAEDLPRLVVDTTSDTRYPALETIVAKGRHFSTIAKSPDHFRFALFGVDADGHLPIAAVTRMGDSGQDSQSGQYWLRVDPVTLWADMARVVMTRHGLADLDPIERNDIENTVRKVLLEEGIQLHAEHPERWCIALDESPNFDFFQLADALGMDMAEAMPRNPATLHWRRIMNEIQMALHACEVNVRRRQQGLHDINSVWFWGGGFLPDLKQKSHFDHVHTNNPVSRGLAAITDADLQYQSAKSPAEACASGQSVLIDWSSGTDNSESELDQLESVAAGMLQRANEDAAELVLCCGGDGFRYHRACKRKFWLPRHKLDRLCKNRMST